MYVNLFKYQYLLISYIKYIYSQKYSSKAMLRGQVFGSKGRL